MGVAVSGQQNRHYECSVLNITALVSGYMTVLEPAIIG